MTKTHPWSEILHKVSGEDDLRYRVTHIRREHWIDQEILAKGGETLVQIGRMIDMKGKQTFVEVARGKAHCHPLDNYDKKIGRDIALRAALKQFKELYAPQDAIR